MKHDAWLDGGRGRRRPRRAAGWLFLLVLALWAGAPAWAGEVQSAADDQAMGFFIAPQIKRFLRSHTSYQFGDPFHPNLNPLSRLEFPLNSWWAGVGLGLRGPRASLELELLAALPGQDGLGAMRDSDWDEASHPKVRTIYSESKTRLKDSFTLDGKVTHAVGERLGLPAWLDLRPLVGVRWQRFVLVTHDGTQQTLDSDPGQPDQARWSYQELPGDGIWFRQEYLHAYLGAQLTVDLGRLGLGRPGGGWRISLQGDLAQVWGQNQDRHLLRAGNRVTEERTQGHAWHTALSLRAPLAGWGALVASGEYMMIRTRGEHTLDNPDFDIHLTFDRGVEVWSRQRSWSLAWEVEF